MVINHNIASLNANRMMGVNQSNSSKSMEKLSSGMRINRAGDDAAGLAISEKMRAQVRGLDQAAANGQDGISMIQTAEGGLSETHSILQRMRELAVQSSNDTNVAVDRSEIQKEMDELAKEVTRISNNTEFNTQKLINGGITDGGLGSAKFHIGANASQDITLSINAMDAKSLGIARDVSAATVDPTNAAGVKSAKVDAADVSSQLAVGDYKVTVANVAAGATNATSTSTVGTIAAGATTGTALKDTNITLTYTASAATAGAAQVGSAAAVDITANGTLKLSIDGTAVDTNLAIGDNAAAVASKINIAANTAKGTTGQVYATIDGAGKLNVNSLTTGTTSRVAVVAGGTAQVLTDLSLTVDAGTAGAAKGAGASTWEATGDLSGTVTGGANNSKNGVVIDVSKLSGFVNGQTVTVTGRKDASMTAQLTTDDASPVAIGSALTINQSKGGTYTLGDGTTGQAKVTFAAGEAKVGTSTITVGTTAATTAAKQADGTMSESTVQGGLNVSNQSAASESITTIQSAIETVSAERSKLGAYQNRLEHTIANLGTSSENLTSAESRIRDVDMAKEMSTFSKNNILAQAAQSMLAQANQQPQQVLQLLQ